MLNLRNMRLVLKLPLLFASGIVALLIACSELHKITKLGLSDLRGFGVAFIIVILLAAIAPLAERKNVKWVMLSCCFIAMSMAVDLLPLLSFGKAQIALALVVLGQWFSIQFKATTVVQLIFVIVTFVLGSLIEAVFFLAVLEQRNLVHVF